MAGLIGARAPVAARIVTATRTASPTPAATTLIVRPVRSTGEVGFASGTSFSLGSDLAATGRNRQAGRLELTSSVEQGDRLVPGDGLPGRGRQLLGLVLRDHGGVRPTAVVDADDVGVGRGVRVR